MKEFQAFKDTLSNKALKAIYEESKLGSPRRNN